MLPANSSYLFNRKGIKLQLPLEVIINNILLCVFLNFTTMLVWSLAKQLSSLKRNVFKSAIFCNGVHTVNSKKLFKPQNAKLAQRTLELMRPILGLFQSLLLPLKQPTVGPNLAMRCRPTPCKWGYCGLN